MDRLASIVRYPQSGPEKSAQIDSTLCATSKAGRVIAVTSGKGGVGKSNISVNLSIALSQLGQKVCLFDADLNLANTNILLGLTPSLTLHDFLNQQLDISKILSPGPEGIQIVPAATGIANFINLDKGQQTHLLTALQEQEQGYDYLIIDTAAGVNEALINFLLSAPYTIITITPEPTSLTDAFSLLKALKQRGFNHSAFVIVNMVGSRQAASDAFKRFSGAVNKYLKLKLHYLGYIPNDSKVSESVRKQQAVLLRHPQTAASQCLQDISGRLQQLLDAQGGPGDSGFSAYFDALSDSDLSPPPAEVGATCALTNNPDPAWDMKKAMDYLGGISSDEAVEFLAEAILNWDESNNDIYLAVQQRLLDRAVSTIRQDEPSLSQDQLLRHTVSDLEVENEQEAATSALELHPATTEEKAASSISLPDSRPGDPLAGKDDALGLLAAIRYASLLDAKERSSK